MGWPRMHRLPKLGEKVTVTGKSAFCKDLAGLVGEVADIISGACGPIVAVKFDSLPGQTFDLFWKKVAAVGK